ncbi:MAG: 3-deoxy-manno-octulosonate cytidylyltransferase [Planctomycetaceae bacterium]|nr:3-deoxy-manno-octulosonate cytidylyltransferase [Planctomycetaceae bacterium]
MIAYGIIPARLASTRLPRKLLLQETSKPLLQHTWEAAIRARELSEVIVATDSDEIFHTVTQFGGRAEMTGEHNSGTDRIAEVARRCSSKVEVFVNIQGDEPELEPGTIDLLVRLLEENPNAEIATLATPFKSRADLESTSCVKAVCSPDGRALYFSRLPIPFARDADVGALLKTDNSPWLLHLGIYAYRRDFLLKFSQLPQSPLERLEKLEQLRALEYGATIQVGIIEHAAVGIDTPEEYALFVERQHRNAAGKIAA